MSPESDLENGDHIKARLAAKMETTEPFIPLARLGKGRGTPLENTLGANTFPSNDLVFLNQGRHTIHSRTLRASFQSTQTAQGQRESAVCC